MGVTRRFFCPGPPPPGPAPAPAGDFPFLSGQHAFHLARRGLLILARGPKWRRTRKYKRLGQIEANSLNNQGVRTPPTGGVGRSVHTFRRELFVKFRKSPHRTEKSLRHAQKPATPRSANPCGPESTSVTPGKDPPMATPPQGRKMTPERPFPILIETGKSHPKTGLCRWFAGGLPVVCRWFAGGLPGAPTATWTTTTTGSRWPPRQGTLVVSADRWPTGPPRPGRCFKSTHSAPRQHPTAPHGRKFRRCIPKPYSPLDYVRST